MEAGVGRGKKANRILLLAHDMRGICDAYRAGHLTMEATCETYTSWVEIENKLKRYSVISELTILGHAGPGTFLFKNRSGGFDEISLKNATASLKRGGRLPTVGSIHLQSCNAGLDATPLRDFANLFGTSQIVAWNHFYVAVVRRVSVPPGLTQEQLRSKLRNDLAYLAPDVDLATLAAVAGKYDVLVEWFRVEQSEKEPPAVGPPGDLNVGRKPFKTWRSAQDRNIRNQEELNSLNEELREFNFIEPAKPLYRITVHPKTFGDSKQP